MSQTISNLRIWDQLGKTDPAHTKQFQRSGGFKGTAIKPMWCNLRMTEYFGPCGIGWGPDQPEYQVVPAEDEILVFCTVGLWYIEPDSDKRAQVFGVGGDKLLIKGNNGTRTSDEAFKAAYTDAMSNAMKLIGVAADVHMGLFDDSKYVQEMKAEFSGPDTPQPVAPQPRQQPQQSSDRGPKISEPQSKRFFAMAKTGNKTNDDIRRYLMNVCHCEKSLDMAKSDYEKACTWACSIPAVQDPSEITDDDIPF